MEFKQSTFTVEVNQIPTLVFQAKWATEAEDIGFGWAQDHTQQISTKGPHGTDLPAVIKVRVARRDEKAAYEARKAMSTSTRGLRSSISLISTRYLESVARVIPRAPRISVMATSRSDSTLWFCARQQTMLSSRAHRRWCRKSTSRRRGSSGDAP